VTSEKENQMSDNSSCPGKRFELALDQLRNDHADNRTLENLRRLRQCGLVDENEFDSLNQLIELTEDQDRAKLLNGLQNAFGNMTRLAAAIVQIAVHADQIEGEDIANAVPFDEGNADDPPPVPPEVFELAIDGAIMAAAVGSSVHEVDHSTAIKYAVSGAAVACLLGT
jgi:hypothetical protein